MSFILESFWQQSVKTLPITDPVQALDFYQALKGMGPIDPTEPGLFSPEEVCDLFERKFSDGLIQVPGCWSLRDVLFEGWIRRPKRNQKRFANIKRINIIKPKGVRYDVLHKTSA
jgi:hypothetical protein